MRDDSAKTAEGLCFKGETSSGDKEGGAGTELVWLIGNQRAEMKMLIAVSPWFKSVRVKGEMGNVLKRVELLFKEGRYEEIKHHARVKTAEKTKGVKGKIRSGAFWGVLLLQATWRQPELMASLFPELTQSSPGGCCRIGLTAVTSTKLKLLHDRTYHCKCKGRTNLKLMELTTLLQHVYLKDWSTLELFIDNNWQGAAAGFFFFFSWQMSFNALPTRLEAKIWLQLKFLWSWRLQKIKRWDSDCSNWPIMCIHAQRWLGAMATGRFDDWGPRQLQNHAPWYFIWRKTR